MDSDNDAKVQELLCFLCQDFYVKPCTALCGHTFCSICLDEYLIYADVILFLIDRYALNARKL